MHDRTIIVQALVPSRADTTNLRKEAWNFALDQRVFGPRQLLVGFANRKGRFRGLAYTDRTDPPELALTCCIEHLGKGAAAAIAFSDETVGQGPPPDDLTERFARATAVCQDYGIHLVDWIACDDQLFRSTRLSLHPGGEWWDIP